MLPASTVPFSPTQKIGLTYRFFVLNRSSLLLSLTPRKKRFPCCSLDFCPMTLKLDWINHKIAVTVPSWIVGVENENNVELKMHKSIS